MRDIHTHIYYQGGRPFGASNADGTCLWCGRKLRAPKRARETWFPKDQSPRGDYADNAFCGAGCAACFGLHMAAHGSRFEPKRAA